jgi:putative endonuclease
MPRERRYYAYMTTSSSRRALYTDMTNSIYNRHDQHLDSDPSSFVGRYRALRLAYVEVFRDVRNAIAREKEIKGWTRAKKEALVRSTNPQWRDLSADFGKQFEPVNQPQDPSRPEPGAQDDKLQKGTG